MSNNENRWWVSVNDRPTGPWTKSEIFLKIRDRELTLKSLACPVGGDEWKTIELQTELSDGKPSPDKKPYQQFPTAEPVNPYESAYNFHVPPKDSGWPAMASILTFYCLVFSPIYLIGTIFVIWFHYLAEIQDTIFQHAEYFYQGVSLAICFALTFLYPIAGLKLFQRDRSAIWYTIAALCVDLLGGLLNLFVMAFTALIVMKIQQYSQTPVQKVSNSGFSFLELLALSSWVLTAWAVVALVWFVKNFRKLAWRRTVELTEEGQR